MDINPKADSVEEHKDDTEIEITTGQGEHVEEFRLVEQLFRNWYMMIRWFLVRYLNARDVMRLTSVKKLVTDIMFSQGNFKKHDFGHFIE